MLPRIVEELSWKMPGPAAAFESSNARTIYDDSYRDGACSTIFLDDVQQNSASKYINLKIVGPPSVS